MATYKSGEVTLNTPAENVYNKLSNLENLRGLLDKVPADKVPDDQRKMLEEIEVTPDTLTFPGGPMGKMTFRVTEREPGRRIVLTGEGAPIALGLKLNIEPVSDNESKAQVEIDIDLPIMLKPLVGGQIQKMADQFGGMLQAIPFA